MNLLVFACVLVFSFCQGISNTTFFNTTGFTYRQKINIFATELSDGYSTEEILLFLDTKHMVEEDYILKDCSDLVFIHNRTGERIPHFIENECGQEKTRFYLSMNLSSIPEENEVFMYFRFAQIMDSLEEEFDGKFFEMRSDTCNTEKGWKYDESFEGRFPFINSKKANGVSGSLTSGDHSHLLIVFSEQMYADPNHIQKTSHDLSSTVPTTGMNHNHVVVLSIDNEEEILPPHKEKFFCQNSKLEVTQGAIGLFESENDIPSGFIKIEERDSNGDYCLLIGGKNNQEGGKKTHKHQISGEAFYSDNVQYVSNVQSIGVYEVNHWYSDDPYYEKPGRDHQYPDVKTVTFPMEPISSQSHKHVISGTCTEASNIPSNIVEFVFGQNEMGDYDFTNDKMLIMANGKPPFGFDIVDENDGYFLRNGDTYSKIGTTKDNQIIHNHDFSITLESSQESVSANSVNSMNDVTYYETYERWGNYGKFTYFNLYDPIVIPDKSKAIDAVRTAHYHNAPTENKEGTEELPIRNVLLLKRKPIVANITIDSLVEKIGELEERVIVVEPGCFPECINNGNCTKKTVSDSDYYICNCTAKYTGNYCQTLIPDGEDEGVNYTMLLVIIGVSGVSAILLGLCILIFVVMLIACIVLQRKKRSAYSKKMIDSLVNGIDKEQELQTQKEQLEEEKIKLETDKKKLEEEKKKEQEEKEQLKKALENLKAEKMKLENQSTTSKPIKRIEKEDIKNLKKLIGMKNGYETFKGTFGKETVLFRVFKEDLFSKNTYFRDKNLLEFEVNEYSSYNHPNIIKFKAISFNPTVGVVTEFPFNGSLVNYLKKKGKGKTFLQKVRLFYEIANGIQYLHKKGKNHGNLRAENIWITKELRPILDFGFNKSIDTKQIYSQYCAPELIKPQKVEDFDFDEDIEDSPHLKADIYALGILMFEIVSENFNLYNIPKGKKEKLGEKVSNDEEYRPSLKRAKYYPNWFINLIKMCWAHDLERRPNISRIKTIIETIVFGDEEE